MWKGDIFKAASIIDTEHANDPRVVGRLPVRKLKVEIPQGPDEYFVRVKYNDRIMALPGCRTEGKHLEGDETVCTLVSAPTSCRGLIFM